MLQRISSHPRRAFVDETVVSACPDFGLTEEIGVTSANSVFRQESVLILSDNYNNFPVFLISWLIFLGI
jgi:hypothetical protein